jgi:hypothetical protein
VHQHLASPPIQLTFALPRKPKRYLPSIPSFNPWSSLFYVRCVFLLMFYFLLTISFCFFFSFFSVSWPHTHDIQHFFTSYRAPEFSVARDFETISQRSIQVCDHLPRIRSSRHYGLEMLVQLLGATALTMRRSLLRKSFIRGLQGIRIKDSPAAHPSSLLATSSTIPKRTLQTSFSVSFLSTKKPKNIYHCCHYHDHFPFYHY